MSGGTENELKKDLEDALRLCYKQSLDLTKRECIFNLPTDLDAYVIAFGLDKEAMYRKALLKQIIGDDMNYTIVLQELVDDIRFNHEASFERKQALVKLKEVHMWLKASANRYNEGELILTSKPTQEPEVSDV